MALGESPVWHAGQQQLYCCDIPARTVHRIDPATGITERWMLESEVGSLALIDGSQDLLLACRDGLWRFDPQSGRRHLLMPPPYDPAEQRFNDGKCDPLGRFWVGTLHERREPRGALYCYDGETLAARCEGIATSNGLAWSPAGDVLYASDTRAHTIYCHDFEGARGAIANRAAWVRFEPREPQASLDSYGGRPDGAAVDVEGAYWVAMFEGQRLLRLSAQGQCLQEIRLPVRCPTMPCFGGADLRTLYITTARSQRPADELAAQPWAGHVLRLRVDVPGVPVPAFRASN
jgi:sugar lactone lactonase YvrE